MLKTLDQMLLEVEANAPETAQRFKLACRDCFSGGDFQIVLEMLCRFAHPLSSPLRETPTDTACVVGRSEVIAFLIRHGSREEVPTILTK